MNVLVIPSWYPNGTDKLMGIYHKEFTEALIKNNISANMLYKCSIQVFIYEKT